VLASHRDHRGLFIYPQRRLGRQGQTPYLFCLFLSIMRSSMAPQQGTAR
jgi:hypothetical protein